MDAIGQALVILGLGPDATSEDVKQAYRDLAKVWHPDRFQNDPRVRNKAEEKLKEINEAYKILKNYNPASRKQSHSGSASSGRTQQPQDEERNQASQYDRQSPPFESSAEGEPNQPASSSPNNLPLVFSFIGVVLTILILGILAINSNMRQPLTLPRTTYDLFRQSNPRPSPSPQVGALDIPPTWLRSGQSRVSGESSSRQGDSDLRPNHSHPEKHPQPSGTRNAISEPRAITPEQPRHVAPGSFTVGSTKDEVIAVQGTPTEFNEHTWKYGYSSIFFNNGSVTTWEVSPAGQHLKVRMLPSQSIDARRGYFTVGSTKDEVIAIQGTPTEFNEHTWKYGYSSIYFNNGSVTTWEVSPAGQHLKVRMLPSQSIDARRGYFTVGSTKDEVIAIQGTPTEFNEHTWKYGYSSIFFNNGSVTTWEVSPAGQHLKVRMLPSQSIDARRGYFTVGSTKDEVIAIQGTPTEFNEHTWKYGYSSIFFKNGRVTSWEVSPAGEHLRLRIKNAQDH